MALARFLSKVEEIVDIVYVETYSLLPEIRQVGRHKPHILYSNQEE